MASLHEGEVKIPLLDVDEEKAMSPRSHDVDVEKGECAEQDIHAQTGVSYIRSVVIVLILAFINLLNFIERFSMAGVLPNLQSSFKISDDASGLISSAFIASYVLLGPVFGYIGDRWNRKYIMCVGISFWSGMTLCSSFVPDVYFPVFLLVTGLVGAGEASFTTIAPSVIADLFVADQRSRMLSIYYLAIPVGSGLGYIIGSKVTSAAGGDWHWAFRVTPGLGVIAVLLLIVFMKEPPRGAADGKNNIKSKRSKNWMSDVKKLFKNRSFLFTTLGTTTMSFVAGAVGFWAPSFLERARDIIQKEPCHTGTCSYNDSMIFGILTVISGIVGVIIGVEISKRWRKITPRADAYVCACGMLGSAPFLFLALALANISLTATYVLIFIGVTLLTLNWAVVVDILMSVVPSTKRSTAHAMQVMVSHLLGDAGSPYLIGFISNLIHRYAKKLPLLHFHSLQYALMICAFVEVIGGVFFLATASYVQKDRERADMEDED